VKKKTEGPMAMGELMEKKGHGKNMIMASHDMQQTMFGQYPGKYLLQKNP